jgi:uncharacterized protein YaiI (UPF0178 family)
MLYVDADACPVRDEALKVAERYGIEVISVTTGGRRPAPNPLARGQVGAAGADAADKWIAERIGPGDVCVTTDVPLAARVVEAGAVALTPDGQPFTAANVGARLALRDLMADLRAADPFRQGGGKSFRPADRSRFLDALDRLLRPRPT